MGDVKRPDKRILMIFVLLAVGLGIVTIRLFHLQVALAEEYRGEAKGQRMTVVDLPAKRGLILDRNGEVLADSLEVQTVYATPYLVNKKAKAAEKIASVLGMPKEKVNRLLATDSGFVYIARKIDPRLAGRLRTELAKAKIDGIGYIKETKRVYPMNAVGAQIIGFSDIDGNGQAGIELYYDSIIKGKPGKFVAELDQLGHELPGGFSNLKSPVDGMNLRLTIDKDIQYKTQLELEKAVKEYKAVAGTAVVMNPTTGEIYAMATAPTFNPNDDSVANADLTRNRAITDTYEPGSTMKVFTVSGALEEKIVDPETSFFLPPTIEVGGRTIGEAHGREGREFTVSEVIQESSNVGAVTLGLKMGEKKICEYVEKFGLNELTGVDLPGETAGYMPPLEEWSAPTIGNIPFGQGLAVTPLGMTRALSAIANDGKLPYPHLLVEVADGSGKTVKEYKQREGRQVISAETVGEMRDMLEKVITDGTGGSAAVEGYRVAGKTGTAQKPTPEAGYASGLYVGSFMGYLPSRNPQVAIIVALDEPKNGYYGGVVAGPAFKSIAEYSVRHLRVP
ncbi:MAG: peptidoglycan D,D-transpeptidase FtsI family protein, partial [Candidatus Aquicultorales bacterium]